MTPAAEGHRERAGRRAVIRPRVLPRGRTDSRVMSGQSAGHPRPRRCRVAARTRSPTGVLDDQHRVFRARRILPFGQPALERARLPLHSARAAQDAPAARAYMGVGPEQNFNYIAALRPKMAFIVDIRQGNLRPAPDVQGAVRAVERSRRFRVAAVLAQAAGGIERRLDARSDFRGVLAGANRTRSSIAPTSRPSWTSSSRCTVSR